MEIKISRKDILSGYIAQLFNYGTGILVLPVILNKLSPEEIGMNYVMLSVGALANMTDFGFSGQIGRNVTYVLSGAQKIYRNEIEIIEKNNTIDYNLLRTIIDASKFLYKRLSLAVLCLLLTVGSAYMYYVTQGFKNVENSLIIWIAFSVSVYFNLYFLYYNSLLTGAALIMEQRLATIYSRLSYIVICFILIFSGLGLISVVTANLISPFVGRYYSYRSFYTKGMFANLPNRKTCKKDILSALSDIWATAKKSGTNTIGHYIGTQGSMFIAGFYLSLNLVAQWGLLTQLIGVVQGFSMNLCMSYYPEYCKYRLKGDKDSFIQKSSYSVVSMIIILALGGFLVILLAPILLELINSKTQLPSFGFMFSYLVFIIITCNAQAFAMMMTARNVIPSPKAILVTCFTQIMLTIVFLYLNLAQWALLLGPLVSGCAYTLWKWMQLELNDMGISADKYYLLGLNGCIAMAVSSAKKCIKYIRN